MPEFNQFLQQAFWWMSLLAAIHCFLLGLYMRYLYQERTPNHKLLAALLSLMGIYFLSGTLVSGQLPLPLHLLYLSVFPIYFLLMPLLYLYCYRSLHKITTPLRLSWHFMPALIILIVVITAMLWRQLWLKAPLLSTPNDISELTQLGVIGTAIPGLLTLQATIYFFLIFNTLRQFRGRASRAHQMSLRDIKFRWLLVLTLCLMVNWLIRTLMLTVPFYFYIDLPAASLVLPRLLMLISIYALAFYGLKQITRAAYLRGKLSITPANHAKASSQLLDSEELAFLHKVLTEPPSHK
ncbi:hypothetical protein [Shewanella sp. NIFS-20-20]|uniref:hypothetical protein n=1 Tax=Shewanella sp. NIFS-20-20 TaxID=2853806 RepID=UPI001C4371A5|nr:hypothetical protein [Shewanella sp. NIFS-20-20]MBV7315653.1 hypothetical protein [Shewanella sp. NIFS-20-20]